jgi:hypothetical protein
MTCREDYPFSQYQTSMELRGFQSEKEAALELFTKRCGRPISAACKESLVKKIPDQTKFRSYHFTQDDKKRKIPPVKRSNIHDHHLFELLGWNPQAIILIALLWKNNPNLTLGTLYETVADQIKLDAGTDHFKLNEKMHTALMTTTKVQVAELYNWELPCYKLMQLLSFLPAFNSVSELKSLWKKYEET